MSEPVEAQVVDETKPLGLQTTEKTTAAMTTAGHAAGEREKGLIQAQMVMAQRFPRDEEECYARMIKAVKRPGMANKACYSFPRGGKTVKGESVYLAREMARVWGNLDCGYAVVDSDDVWITIEGWAIDLQTNTRQRAQTRIKNQIFRKGKGWITPDERDRLEMIGRSGAKLYRNCMLDLIPFDVREEVVAQAHKTLVKAAAGSLEDDRDQTIRAMVGVYLDLGVTQEMIEGRLGHPLAQIDADELADLREVFGSIRDGNTSIGEHFPMPERKTSKAGTLDDMVAEKGKPEKPKPEPTRKRRSTKASRQEAQTKAKAKAEAEAKAKAEKKPEPKAEASPAGEPQCEHGVPQSEWPCAECSV